MNEASLRAIAMRCEIAEAMECLMEIDSQSLEGDNAISAAITSLAYGMLALVHATCEQTEAIRQQQSGATDQKPQQ
jgi:hypothetical protein